MAIRITGMNSGLDTDSIITELVKAKSAKVDTLKKEQTKLQYKQDAWKDLNSKILKLYNNAVTNLSLSSSYQKKKTDVSNSNAVSVTTSNNAMNSVQKLKISKLATSGYLTGAKVAKADGSSCSGSTKLTELGITAGSSFNITTGGKTTQITVDESTTMEGLASKLKSAGVEANFDSSSQRFYIGSKESGKEGDFAITAANADGADAIGKLGIALYDADTMKTYQAYAAMASDPSKKQTELDSMIATRLASHTSRNNSLLSQIEKKQEAYDKALKSGTEAFNTEFGSDAQFNNLDDLLNNTNGAYDSLKQQYEAMKGQEDILTEDEKTHMNKLGSKLTIADNLKSQAKEIKDLQTQQADVQKYINADGTASNLLKTETEASLDNMIAVAVDIVNNQSSYTASDAKKIVGQDAVIELNGVEYTSSSNKFDINGLMLECKAETTGDEEITLTTKDDTSGVYDMVKNFIKDYNELINEMDKLYNAESSKGYEPLTDEEKDAMSESEIEKWEDKIKNSILRRDSTVNNVAGAMKEMMNKGFTVNGKTMYLFDFGIEKAGYFSAEANERNSFNINGDSDFASVATEDNGLMAMIESDPEAVTSFFTQMSQSLKDKMYSMMTSTEFSSSFTMYDDKKMKTDYGNYTTKIKEAEKKLKAYEDKWYSKFTAMETALAKMQSNSSAVTSLLGG